MSPVKPAKKNKLHGISEDPLSPAEQARERLLYQTLTEEGDWDLDVDGKVMGIDENDGFGGFSEAFGAPIADMRASTHITRIDARASVESYVLVNDLGSLDDLSSDIPSTVKAQIDSHRSSIGPLSALADFKAQSTNSSIRPLSDTAVLTFPKTPPRDKNKTADKTTTNTPTKKGGGLPKSGSFQKFSSSLAAVPRQWTTKDLLYQDIQESEEQLAKMQSKGSTLVPKIKVLEQRKRVLIKDAQITSMRAKALDASRRSSERDLQLRTERQADLEQAHYALITTIMALKARIEQTTTRAKGKSVHDSLNDSTQHLRDIQEELRSLLQKSQKACRSKNQLKARERMKDGNRPELQSSSFSRSRMAPITASRDGDPPPPVASSQSQKISTKPPKHSNRDAKHRAEEKDTTEFLVKLLTYNTDLLLEINNLSKASLLMTQQKISQFQNRS